MFGMPHKSRVCHGLTLVEMLVVLAIMGFLFAVLLPAAMSAREASRRMACGNHLRQIGLASSNYDAIHGVMPPAALNGFSSFVRMLPYLEQENSAQSFDLDIPPYAASNREAGTRGLPTLRCPSDPEARGGDWTNYAVNFGRGFPYSNDGPFHFMVRSADIADGASRTAAIAEWALPPKSSRRGRRGMAYVVTSSLAVPARFEEFATRCRTIDVTSAEVEDLKGKWWYEGLLSQSGYNHTLPVNGHSCSNDGTTSAGAWSAESHHPGGANVAFADAHVEFIAESVALAVWRALGSRSGGEIDSNH